MLCGYQTAFTLMGLGSFHRRGPGWSTAHPEGDPDLPLIFSDPHPRMLESQRSSCTLASDGEKLPIQLSGGSKGREGDGARAPLLPTPVSVGCPLGGRLSSQNHTCVLRTLSMRTLPLAL